jgi:thiamine-phosphate pyrophosphorylase
MLNEYRLDTLVTQLYLISPPAIHLAAFEKELTAALSAAPKGFVGSFQLRLKDVDDDAIRAATNALLPICHAHEVAFILNDRPDLCAELGADGVHLGQEDLEQWPIQKTRKIIGEEAIIGVSCHASKHLAMEAGEQGADYVAFGAFYETTSKPMEKLLKWGTPTPKILEWWSSCTTLPCVAIGGITPQNCAPLADADFIAVITAVWNHKDGAGAGVSAFSNALNAPQNPAAPRAKTSTT